MKYPSDTNPADNSKIINFVVSCATNQGKTTIRNRLKKYSKKKRASSLTPAFIF
jgi:Flp pilus assembly CpaF family ATPase